jgi:hypothetical protein
MDRKVRSGHLCRGGDLSHAALGWFIGPLGNRTDLMQRGGIAAPAVAKRSSDRRRSRKWGTESRINSLNACLFANDPDFAGLVNIELNAGPLKDVLYLEDRTLPAALAIRVISSSTARFSCLSVFTFPVSASTLIAPVLKSAPDSWYSR